VKRLMAMGPQSGGPVFRIDQNVLKMRYRRAVMRAGIDDLTFHDLRHIATSRLAKLYPNPLDLKRVTGHKDLKSLDRYYHATALQRVMPAERLLQRVKRPGLTESFDRGDRLALRLDGEHQATADGVTIREDSAGPAHAVGAADMGTGQVKPVAQQIRQRPAGIEVADDMELAIDAHRYRNASGRVRPRSEGGQLIHGLSPLFGRSCRGIGRRHRPLGQFQAKAPAELGGNEAAGITLLCEFLGKVREAFDLARGLTE